jgi:hypothetical protein
MADENTPLINTTAAGSIPRRRDQGGFLSLLGDTLETAGRLPFESIEQIGNLLLGKKARNPIVAAAEDAFASTYGVNPRDVQKEAERNIANLNYAMNQPAVEAAAAIEQNRANINPNVQQFLPREAPASVSPQFPGQTLSQFMRYEDTPQAVTMQALDPQGRLRQFTQGGELTPQLSAFEQASADREARLAQEEFLRAAQRTGSKAAIDAAQASVFDIPQQQAPTAGAVASLLYATEQAGIKGESRKKLFDTLGITLPGEEPKPETLLKKPPKEPKEAVAEVSQVGIADTEMSTTPLSSLNLAKQFKSTFDPSELSEEDLTAYNFALRNPNNPDSKKILIELGAL